MQKLVPENHQALHRIADEVPPGEIGSKKIRKVIKDMRAALYSYSSEGFIGVAIAAPQIGVSLRIFLVEDTGEKRDESEREPLPSLVAINPQIVKLSRKKELIGEGCLSVDGRYGKVERAVRATIRAYGENGEQYERGASGLLAQIFQHEVDHLDGILYIDRAVVVMKKEEMDNVRQAA